MKYKTEQKILEAQQRNITLPQELATMHHIVCIYGIFAMKENKEECFYIGKTTNLMDCLFTPDKGHIDLFLKGNEDKIVPFKIGKFINYGYMIEVRILDIVDYFDTTFSKAAHRLTFAQLKRIVEYQEKGQCLNQKIEGVEASERRFWEANYKLN